MEIMPNVSAEKGFDGSSPITDRSGRLSRMEEVLHRYPDGKSSMEPNAPAHQSKFRPDRLIRRYGDNAQCFCGKGFDGSSPITDRSGRLSRMEEVLHRYPDGKSSMEPNGQKEIGGLAVISADANGLGFH
ncbi:hypothetical protein CDAR_557081 [Caerostris darwini]|uniref:Uncharacterized protein n=1 Tax=Caerostris darwini TaxID=1538125 RepID=A0AAV4TZW8_9ARAC|nr:hypothetical protein CDAR_557081 [Caerostris darwini]